MAVPSNADRKKDPHSARFGDLIITISGVESTEAEPHKGDRQAFRCTCGAINFNLIKKYDSRAAGELYAHKLTSAKL